MLSEYVNKCFRLFKVCTFIEILKIHTTIYLLMGFITVTASSIGASESKGSCHDLYGPRKTCPRMRLFGSNPAVLSLANAWARPTSSTSLPSEARPLPSILGPHFGLHQRTERTQEQSSQIWGLRGSASESQAQNMRSRSGKASEPLGGGGGGHAAARELRSLVSQAGGRGAGKPRLVHLKVPNPLPEWPGS